jgi:WASH complex subunit 7
MNMYDMETYEQIRTMGNYLFGLELQNVYLPSQTIDQGQFDILNILRNIPEFV